MATGLGCDSYTCQSGTVELAPVLGFNTVRYGVVSSGT